MGAEMLTEVTIKALEEKTWIQKKSVKTQLIRSK